MYFSYEMSIKGLKYLRTQIKLMSLTGVKPSDSNVFKSACI